MAPTRMANMSAIPNTAIPYFLPPTQKSSSPASAICLIHPPYGPLFLSSVLLDSAPPPRPPPPPPPSPTAVAACHTHPLLP
eukprot:2700891-Pyramimonas_sp.AAC.1